MSDFENDYTEEGVEDIDFDVAADIDLDEEHDRMLAQQELEDFAQDGYFENMEPMGDGFWG